MRLASLALLLALVPSAPAQYGCNGGNPYGYAPPEMYAAPGYGYAPPQLGPQTYGYSYPGIGEFAAPSGYFAPPQYQFAANPAYFPRPGPAWIPQRGGFEVDVRFGGGRFLPRQRSVGLYAGPSGRAPWCPTCP